jgi:hypothetical protein
VPAYRSPSCRRKVGRKSSGKAHEKTDDGRSLWPGTSRRPGRSVEPSYDKREDEQQDNPLADKERIPRLLEKSTGLLSGLVSGAQRHHVDYDAPDIPHDASGQGAQEDPASVDVGHKLPRMKQNVLGRQSLSGFLVIDGVEGGRTLLDFVAAAIGADDLSLFVFREGQGFREGFRTRVAEEFVCGHTPRLDAENSTPN